MAQRRVAQKGMAQRGGVRGGADSQLAVQALLLQIAGVLDVAVSFVVLRLISQVAGIRLDDWESVLLLGLAVVVAHWLLIEVFLQGRSLGRAAVGIELRDGDGRYPTPRLGLRRFLARTIGCWRGLSPGHLAPHNKPPTVSWRVSLFGDGAGGHGGPAPQPRPGPTPRPDQRGKRPALPAWQLMVVDGPHRGTTIRLAEVPNFRNRGILRIGRHPDWADLKLPGNPKVSRQHAEIRRSGDRLSLWDVGSDGRGSSHGTYVHGRKVPPGSWVEIGNADHFKVADVTLRLLA